MSPCIIARKGRKHMGTQDFNTRMRNAARVEDKIAALDSRAESCFEKGRYADAVKFYGQAFELARQPNVRAYFAGQVGICHFNAGNDKDALHFLLKSARLFQPDAPEF